MAVRGGNNPDADRTAVSQVLRSVLRHLLAEPAPKPAVPALPKS
jgi:hypothetical protein